MYKYIIIIISLIFPFSIQAANCTLKNILFEGLNDRQIEVMKLSGARCTSTNLSDLKFGDPGFVLIDGKKMDFLDVASEDKQFIDDIRDSQQIIYFYLSGLMKETQRQWGFLRGVEFRTSICEGVKGRDIYGRRIVFSSKPTFDIIIGPLRVFSDLASVEAGKAVLKSKSKHNYKMLIKYRDQRGLMKAEGKFGVYSDSRSMYFETDTIDLVASIASR